MLTKTRRIYSLTFIAMAALVLSAVPSFALYSGSLSVAGGGLQYQPEQSPWKDAVIAWDVTQEANGDYTFQYTLNVGQKKGISHVIVEATPGFTLVPRDFYDFQRWDYDSGEWVSWAAGTEVDTYYEGSNGNSNPGMPAGGIFGVKCNTPDNSDWTSLRWRFTSRRQPVWGDFYAKDGVYNDHDPLTDDEVALWNTGFAAVDPLSAPDDPTVTDHIIRPDGGGGQPPITPELPPGALLLLGLVPIGIARLRRRK